MFPLRKNWAFCTRVLCENAVKGKSGKRDGSGKQVSQFASGPKPLGSSQCHKTLVPAINVDGNNDLTLQGAVEGKEMIFLVDTGAVLSLIATQAYKGKFQKAKMNAIGVTGDDLKILGVVKLSVLIKGHYYVMDFHVCDMKYLPYDGILGVNALKTLKVRIDFSNSSGVCQIGLGQFTTEGPKTAPRMVNSRDYIMDEGVMNPNLWCMPPARSMTRGGVAIPYSDPIRRVETVPEVNKVSETNHFWKAVLPQQIVVRPATEMLVRAVLKPTREGQRARVPKEVYIEPEPNVAQGVVFARVVSAVISEGQNLEVQCRLINTGNEEIILSKNRKIGDAQEVVPGENKFVCYVRGHTPTKIEPKCRVVELTDVKENVSENLFGKYGARREDKCHDFSYMVNGNQGHAATTAFEERVRAMENLNSSAGLPEENDWVCGRQRGEPSARQNFILYTGHKKKRKGKKNRRQRSNEDENNLTYAQVTVRNEERRKVHWGPTQEFLTLGPSHTRVGICRGEDVQVLSYAEAVKKVKSSKIVQENMVGKPIEEIRKSEIWRELQEEQEASMEPEYWENEIIEDDNTKKLDFGNYVHRKLQHLTKQERGRTATGFYEV